MKPPHLKAEDIQLALEEVAEIMQARSQRGRLYLVGGAAMMLAYSSDRGTQDVDASIEEGHVAVCEAVREVSERHGWPRTWLNEGAVAYMPERDKRHFVTVLSHPALTVVVATPDVMLAMKAKAARLIDRSDMEKLLHLHGYTTLRQVEEVVEAVFPDEPLTKRQRRDLSSMIRNIKKSKEGKARRLKPPQLVGRCPGKVSINAKGQRDAACVLPAGHRGSHRSIH